MKFRQYLTEQTTDNMAKERIPSLIMALEAAIIKKTDKLPSTAPIAAQMIGSLNTIKYLLRHKLKLTGVEAVREFAQACQGHFTHSFPPLSTLVKKYKLQVDPIRGRVIVEGKSERFGPTDDDWAVIDKDTGKVVKYVKNPRNNKAPSKAVTASNQELVRIGYGKKKGIIREAKALKKKGDKVRVPHKGKMVDGTIVRLDKGRPGGVPYYIVYIGEPASIEVPVHVLKEATVRNLTADVPKMWMAKQGFNSSIRNRINKDIHKILKPTYFKAIPLKAIMDAMGKHGVTLLDDDYTEWSGFFTGGVKDTQMVHFKLGWSDTKDDKGMHRVIPNAAFTMTYFKMPSGKYEVIGYV